MSLPASSELSGVNKDRQDWTILKPRAAIATSGKVPTLDEAKAQFESTWRQLLAWAKLEELS